MAHLITQDEIATWRVCLRTWEASSMMRCSDALCALSCCNCCFWSAITWRSVSRSLLSSHASFLHTQTSLLYICWHLRQTVVNYCTVKVSSTGSWLPFA